MKLLITADWHADARTLGHARFGDVDQAVRQMVNAAAEHRVDAFCFLGDLCDPDAGSSVFRCCKLAISAALMLHRVGIESIWIAGNHDVIEDGSGDTTLSPLCAIANAVRSIHVFERPSVVTRGIGDVSIMALPFTATSHAYRPVGFVHGHADAMRSGKWVVLSHLAVAGVQPGEETTDMPRGREVVLPRELFPEELVGVTIVQGHYHHGQRHHVDGFRDVVIPGAPVRLTFADENREPSFLIVEV